MTENKDHNLIRFFIRIGVTTAAVLLILYLAKVWFVKPASFAPPQMTKGQMKRDQVKRIASLSPVTGDLVIPWQDAAQHYGEYATVEGTIVVTYNSGKACFLNFHPNYRRYFTAVIFASAFPRFPAHPEDHYINKKVRVTGHIKEYEGKPEIILNDPGQIEVLGNQDQGGG